MLCFFFFQAEDGIRDRNVTGVQTCALPILPGSLQSRYQGRAGVIAAGIFARNAKQAGADENFHAGHHFQIKIAGCLEYKHHKTGFYYIINFLPGAYNLL